MKTKGFIALGLLAGMYCSTANAQLQFIYNIFVPSGQVSSSSLGEAVLGSLTHAINPCCEVPFCAACPTNLPGVVSIWIDPFMAIATALDWAATKSHDERTIQAADAIKKLESALRPYDESACWLSLALDDSVAAVYTTENIQAVIKVKERHWDDLFKDVREEVEEYLFATPDGQIKGECTGSDRDCAVERQNEWLVASTTLASATADKVLDKTARGEEETSMASHFEGLKKQFNSKKTPVDMYGAMAEIVLDTHRQMNESNALMGRDLEAQGLRVIRETSPVFIKRPKTEG